MPSARRRQESVHVSSPRRRRLEGLRRFVAAGAGVACCPAGLVAQDVPVLTQACDECRIVFDTLAILGDTAGPGMIAFRNLVVRTDRDGRFFVLDPQVPVVEVFGADGTFKTSVGRRGDGPGEFRWPQGIHADSAGRLFVADRMQPRITIFEPSLGVERTIPIPGLAIGYDLFVLEGDSVLLNGLSFLPDLYGLPVHVLSPEGRRVRSFGAPGGPIVSDDEYRLGRTIAPASDGRVWVAPKDRYRVELWTRGGERVTGFRGSVDWFRPIPTSPALPMPPKGVLSSLRQAPDGLLWLEFMVPAETWPRAHERDPETGRWREVDGDLRHNTVIDVVDPATNRLLARGELYGFHTALFTGPRGEPLIGRVHVGMEAPQVRVLVIGMRLVGRR